MQGYFLQKSKNFILNLLFPKHCLGCNQEGDFICYSCFKKIPIIEKPFLRFNQKGILDGLIITSYYKDPLVKKIIHRYKYDFVKELSEPLGLLMIKRLKTFPNIFNKNNSVLIPIPLHKKRLMWRGFNQSFLLSKQISQRLGIPTNENILIRRKHSLPQMKIQNAKQRKENIKESFCINPDFKDNLANKNIILIDDICTTSATLEECAKALKPLKPKSVVGLVLIH